MARTHPEAPAPPALTNTHPALRRCWHPVARSADVTDHPVRVLLLGEPWVLVRLRPSGHVDAAPVHAFVDRCPHRRAPLSLGAVEPDCPEGDTLRCAYHGWRFDTEGRCVELPAIGPEATIPPRARLITAHSVVERHGMVFLAPTAPLHPPGEVPEAEDPTFMAGDLPPLATRASAGLLADNFLDIAHFPFVHQTTFGASEPVVPPFDIERDGLSFTAVNEHTFLNREDPGVAAGTRPLVQRRRVTYRVAAPFHLVLRLDFLDSGGSNVIGFFLQPESADSCRIWSTLWRDDLDRDPVRMAEAIDFELAVVTEDLRVQEAYDVLALPLDLTAEVHTKADRSTLELRRMLADLVVAASAGVPSARQPSPARG